MIRKNENIMKYFYAAFTAAFIFISIFANSLHTRHPGECTSVRSSCAIGKQVTEIIAASEEHKDCEGDCAACSYLLSAQGACFGNVSLPEKPAPGLYSTAKTELIHDIFSFKNLPRAPPYFIV